MRLAVAQTPAPVDTPRAMRRPDFLESAIENWVTARKLGPGMVTTKNHIPASVIMEMNRLI